MSHKQKSTSKVKEKVYFDYDSCDDEPHPTLYVRKDKNIPARDSTSNVKSKNPSLTVIPRVGVRSRGLMVILNHENFQHQPREEDRRKNNDLHVRQLRDVAKRYKLKTVVFKDSKMSDIHNIVTKLSNYDFTGHKYFALVILTVTHRHGKIAAYDSADYDYHEKITTPLYNINPTIMKVRTIFVLDVQQFYTPPQYCSGIVELYSIQRVEYPRLYVKYGLDSENKWISDVVQETFPDRLAIGALWVGVFCDMMERRMFTRKASVYMINAEVRKVDPWVR